MIYFFFWLISVGLAASGGYWLGWNDATETHRLLARLDRVVLRLLMRGVRP